MPDHFWIATKDCKMWSIDGPNAHGRRLFEQILISSSSLAPLANEIVSVFASVLTVDRDPKVRLALLACLEAFLNRCTDSNDVLTRALRVRSEMLLERVLVSLLCLACGFGRKYTSQACDGSTFGTRFTYRCRVLRYCLKSVSKISRNARVLSRG